MVAIIGGALMGIIIVVVAYAMGVKMGLNVAQKHVDDYFKRFPRRPGP